MGYISFSHASAHFVATKVSENFGGYHVVLETVMQFMQFWRLSCSFRDCHAILETVI
jgi:galactose-1-phosphate uridylyltransferase